MSDSGHCTLYRKDRARVVVVTVVVPASALTAAEYSSVMAPVHSGDGDQSDEIEGAESYHDDGEAWKFCKSRQTNIDEMAQARGLKTKLTFVKPPGFKYKLG